MNTSAETYIQVLGGGFNNSNMYASAPEVPQQTPMMPSPVQQSFSLEELKKFHAFIQQAIAAQELQGSSSGVCYPDLFNLREDIILEEGKKKKGFSFSGCLSSLWRGASFYTKKAFRFITSNTSLIYFPVAGYLCKKALYTRLPEARAKYLNFGYGAALLTFMASPLVFEDFSTKKDQKAKKEEAAASQPSSSSSSQEVATVESHNFNTLLCLLCHVVLSKFDFSWAQFDYGRICFNVPIALAFSLYGVQSALSIRRALSSSFRWMREVSNVEENEPEPVQDPELSRRPEL